MDTSKTEGSKEKPQMNYSIKHYTNCFFVSKFFFFFNFIFGCAGSLLHRLSSSCGERGLFFVAVCRLFIVASHFVEHGL